MARSEISFTQTPSFAEIARFASTVGDKAKIRATDKDGVTTLYASEKKSNIFSRLKEKLAGRPFKSTAEKRAASQETLNRVISRLEGSLSAAVTGNVRTALGALKGQELRGAALKMLAMAANQNALSDAGPRLEDAIRHDEDFGARKVQLLDLAASKGLELEAALQGSLEAARRDDPPAVREFERTIQQIENELVETLQIGDIDQGFVESDGRAFKNELLKALAAKTSPDGPLGPTASKAATAACERFVEGIYQRLTAAAPGSKLNLADPDHPTLQVGDKTYTHVDTFGGGSNGDVFLMQNALDPSDQIVVKLAPLGSDEAAPLVDRRAEGNALIRAECNAHAAIVGDGHENLVGLRGLASATDGRVAMILDYAANGSVHELNKTMKEAVANATLSPKAAMLVALTLGKDMAKGLKAVHAKRGLHGDFKPANMFIDRNGVAKVADFGTGQIGGRFTYRGIKPVENLNWLAPEIIRLGDTVRSGKTPALYAIASAGMDEKEISTLRSDMDQQRGRKVTDDVFARGLLRHRLETTFGDLPDDVIDAFEENIRHGVSDAEERAPITQAADVWSFGVSMFNMLTDKWELRPLGGSDWKFKANLLEISADNPAINAQNGTGFPLLDGFLNRILVVDSTARPSWEAILADPVMNHGGIDAPAVRELINALANGDMEAVEGLSKVVSQF